MSQLDTILKTVSNGLATSPQHRTPTQSGPSTASDAAPMAITGHTPPGRNRAAYYTSQSAHPLEVGDAPMPTPGKDQVTIRTHAVAFNPVDSVMQKTGYMIPSYPAILGCDASGDVVAVGSVAAELGFKVGDRVAGCCDQAGDRAGQGTFQLYSNLQAGMTGKLPDGVGYAEASVLPICLSTAAVGLFDKDTLHLPLPKLEEVEVGKTVLIWGGASSVGSCAIMLAKAAGFKVAATAGSRNLDYVKGIGADFAFDYRSESVVEDIAGSLKGQGEFAGSFACVMGREVYFACAEVCITLGGKQTVSTVLPDFMKFEEKLPGEVQVAYNWGAQLVDNQVGPAIWKDWFTRALEQGMLRCKPDPKVVGRGLEEIQRGLDAIGAGASATKYVVELP